MVYDHLLHMRLTYTDRVRHQSYVIPTIILCSGWFRARGERPMRAGIHPNYKLAKVTCSCGNTFETGSVKEEIRVEVCSECHPFYTGRQKFASADGRIDRFNKKYGFKEEGQE